MTDPLPRRPGSTARVKVVEVRAAERSAHEDRLAVEEPLEIRITAPGGLNLRLGVTMRTPGNDFELAAGWLVHEGVTRPEDIEAVRYCSAVELRPEQEFNVVTVNLTAPPLNIPASRVINSACGVCGADSVSAVAAAEPADRQFSTAVLTRLPDLMRPHQRIFEQTGALHAAGLFDSDGTAVAVREDVGRHNAVDKVCGAQILGHRPTPPILVLSGRVGFELVQKAIVSGVECIVAVGAPTSLAVQLAAESGLVLAGFTRRERMVLYAGGDRVGV